MPCFVQTFIYSGSVTEILFVSFLASALGLQIGLIVVVLLLLGLGAALFTYFYRKRWGVLIGLFFFLLLLFAGCVQRGTKSSQSQIINICLTLWLVVLISSVANRIFKSKTCAIKSQKCSFSFIVWSLTLKMCFFCFIDHCLYFSVVPFYMKYFGYIKRSHVPLNFYDVFLWTWNRLNS